MKNSTIQVRKYLLLFSVLLFSSYSFSQTTLYSENFQSSFGGWTVSSSGSGTGEWLRGTNVSHNTGNTGNYIHSRKDTSQYNNNTFITATSPAINLSGYTNLNLEIDIWYETEAAYDGMKIEYSLNNGSTWSDLGSVTNTNWYNDTDVDAFNNGEDGWSGNSTGWITRNLNLSTENINFETSTQVRFRILFASDGSITNTGVAFDEILIEGNIAVPQPEIDITGLTISIPDGDTTPSTADDTEFGSVEIGSTTDHTFTIHNRGTATLNLTGGSPLVDISGSAAFTILTQPGGSTIAAGASRTFVVRFAPSAAGTVTANISIDNNDSNENPYNFRVQGTGVAPLTEGPGGVTNDLALWLKGTDGLGYTTGQPVSLWADQGRGANATAPTGLEPTYRDAPLFNVNFNPVVDFDNDYDTAGEDFGYSDTNRNTLVGTEGFYTQDMFLVVIPDVNVTSSLASMDVFCGDIDPVTDERDGSGIGYGRYSVRFDNEIISYCVNTTSTSTVPVADRGYGIAHTGLTDNYNNVGIINSKNNSNSPTSSVLLYNANDIGNTEVGVPQFENVSNSRYFLGRSEAFKGSYEGRIAEVITYSAKKDDANLTQERNRIQSYLAIKYGITLGVNGTSQDYVDSDGTLIWDANTGTPAEDVFNYDIAGIGRDDASDLLQKQSRSVNNAIDGGFRAQGVLTIGMGAISNTNNLNTNSELEDKEFLVWGNNGIDLDTASPDITVNMSSSISPALTTDVSFSAISRTWKVVENVGSGGDIPSVEVAILRSAVRTATPPNGRYLMFISDTPNFDPTADYRVMTEGTNELGEAILKTNYDFDDTKYITFGWAPERTFERSVYFNGTSNYMDMEDALDVNPTAFTISSWIRRDVNSLNKSIVSKRDAAFTEGYDLKINTVGQFEASWKTASGAIQTTTSNTIIPENEWHQVAVIYQGGTAYIYIDGILDKQAAKSAPNNTDQSFYIGAASKLTPQAFFNGNIDEVRVWNTALTVKQLRYIMNQEIANNSGFVGGAYFLSKGVTPTKDEVAAIPWSSLAGYYPMSTYTYTNTKDESGNGHQGALRSLRTVDRQTAPLPYKTIGTGTSDWSLHTTWLNGNLQTIPGANSIVDNTITVDWNIVEVDDNVTMSNSSLTAGNLGNRNLLALFVESSELTLDGDNTTETGNGITVTHYLNLLGKIDLEGESQLIQTIDSDLNVGISGSLEKDQQGTLDVFTYNYWSAPVGNTATANPNNFSYSLNNNIMKDGTSSGVPANITYVGGYNGSNSDADLKIAHYWIWKYNNRIADNYASWQHVRNTGTLLAGEGFTMKGVANTAGVVSLEQNYVFDGKPNNGNVGLTINAGNEYLVGNPYASAIDAEQFITDNGPTISGSGANPAISGTLYFWEHWGGGSHVTAEYQGGYGTYNFSGGTPAASMGTNHPDGGTGGTATKTPGRYIPVGQGFFVAGESNGSVVFNNGQRRFQKEGGTGSVFMRSTEDNIDVVDSRMKIRLGFNSVNTIHRQLLVTADDRASIDYDWGFDGLLNEVQIDEMAWVIHADKYTIQGINSFTEDTVLPLNIVTRDDGLNNITIDNLENIPSDLEIYVHDIALDIYHNLRTDGDYEFYLDAGEYADRFEITFRDGNSLGTEDVTAQENLQVYFANAKGSIIIHNPKMVRLDAAEMFNIIGQSVIRIDTLEDTNYQEIKVHGLSTGSYIINLEKTDGSIITKKVIVN
ncbi:LamG-like jellyroll fold domain-containing protein [Bizionia sp.]|uniref:LamG-like jellyroll fold domain-containing protein n=1 Tax=Bizionia sp. TaxID=1954480 RepID=UPI003A9239AD